MSVVNSSYKRTAWNEKSFTLIQVVLFVWHSLTVKQKAIFIGFSSGYANFRRANNMTQLLLVTCGQKLTFLCFRRVLILCMLCTDLIAIISQRTVIFFSQIWSCLFLKIRLKSVMASEGTVCLLFVSVISKCLWWTQVTSELHEMRNHSH
jgi:hypothetical protein